MAEATERLDAHLRGVVARCAHAGVLGVVATDGSGLPTEHWRVELVPDRPVRVVRGGEVDDADWELSGTADELLLRLSGPVAADEFSASRGSERSVDEVVINLEHHRQRR